MTTMKAVCLKSLDNMGILEMNWKKKLAFNDKNYEEPFPNQSSFLPFVTYEGTCAVLSIFSSAQFYVGVVRTLTLRPY